MTSTPSRIERSDLVVIALVSCSMLMYEILLTRISALRLLFHYSFVIVGNCLLGLGASGTLITLCRDRWKRDAGERIFLFCGLYLAALVAVYPFILAYPIWPAQALSDPPDILRFALFNLVVAVPFFFAGLVIGMLLTFNSARVNLVYGLDLVGAALGCAVLPWMLPHVGAGGCFVLVCLLATASWIAASTGKWRMPALIWGAALAVVGLWLLPTLDRTFPVPGKESLNITRDVTTKLDVTIEYSKWTANSRIDMIPIPPQRASIFTRGSKAYGAPLPEEKLILQDGAAGTYILNWSQHPEMLEVLRHSTYSAALRLKNRPRVFVIGIGGGNDVWTAKALGASHVTGIELNAPILEIHRSTLPAWSKGLIDDSEVELLHGEGRSALMRDAGKYDVIQMSGIDTWTALASGAYMLAENYLYTTEAIESLYDHLEDDGIFQIIRMSAEMETLRLLSNVYAVFDQRGLTGFERSVVCLATPDGLVALLVKRAMFTADELRQLMDFAREAGVTAIYVPGLSLGTRAESFVLANDKEAFIRDFPRNLTPTTDDRPYFFNYTKWKNPFAAAKYLGEPTSVSQGNPLFILSQLGLSIVLSVGLIVLPLARSRSRARFAPATGSRPTARQHSAVERAYLRTFLVYFAALGAGFIAIEIVMMQKLTLFLGHPLYSVTVTLFSMLLFTGIGSLISGRWFLMNPKVASVVPAGLVVLVGGFALASPRFVSTFIGLDLPARIALTVVILAPIGVLLGIPFAYGIRLLDRLNPTLIPWAWAVNGCCTVIGSILTVVLSMNFGFNFVLDGALLLYIAAFFAVARASRDPVLAVQRS
jgi:spermine/spermidine synthase